MVTVARRRRALPAAATGSETTRLGRSTTYEMNVGLSPVMLVEAEEAVALSVARRDLGGSYRSSPGGGALCSRP